ASPASEAARAQARAQARSRRPRGTCRHDGTAEPGRARGRGGRAGEGEDAGRGCRAAPSGHKTSTGTPRARAKATRWAVASRPSDGEPSHTASSRLPSATIRSSARTQASRSAGSYSRSRTRSARVSSSPVARRSGRSGTAGTSSRVGIATTRRRPAARAARPKARAEPAPDRTTAGPRARRSRRLCRADSTRRRVSGVRSACPTTVTCASAVPSPLAASLIPPLVVPSSGVRRDLWPSADGAAGASEAGTAAPRPGPNVPRSRWEFSSLRRGPGISGLRGRLRLGRAGPALRSGAAAVPGRPTGPGSRGRVGAGFAPHGRNVRAVGEDEGLPGGVEAEALVESAAARAAGLQVGRQPGAVAAVEDRPDQRGAQALTLPAGGHADHPQVGVGPSRGVDARRQATDQLHPFVVRVYGFPHQCRTVVLLVRVAPVVVRGHGEPQRAGGAVLGEVDPPVRHHDVGEGGHEAVVRRPAVLLTGE